MSDRKEITLHLAARLKEERNIKGPELDALSKLSGVSRSMLSQIERGESSPTVAVLWNLARALNLELSKLLDQDAEPEHPIREVVAAEQTPVIRNRKAGCEIRILSSAADVGHVEVYDICFKGGSSLESTPHRTGCFEHLTVLEGRLAVTSDGQTVTVSEGDTVRYAADVEHAIVAENPARALLIVHNA